MKKVKNKEILNKILDFRSNVMSYKDDLFAYINVDYIRMNNLIMCPEHRHFKCEYDFGDIYFMLKQNNFKKIYVLLLDKKVKIKTKDYIEELRKKNSETLKYFENEKDEYINLIQINFDNDIDVYEIELENINSRKDFENIFTDNVLVFPSLSFDFFILSTYFYYDLICGKKEIVDNFVKMTNKQAIKKLKEIDEDIEDPIRLYDIYGKYFEDLDKK